MSEFEKYLYAVRNVDNTESNWIYKHRNNYFLKLYQKAKDRRNRQYLGIIKFVERQESFRKAIGSSSKLIRKYRKEKLDEKDPKYVEATSQLEWNTRVFAVSYTHLTLPTKA